MYSEFRGGARMALQRWPIILAISTLVAISAAILVLIVSDVVTQSTALRAGKEFRNLSAVVFTPYYGHEGPTPISSDLAQSLQQLVDSNSAYTAVIGNVNSNIVRGGESPAVLLVFGDAIFRTMPYLALCDPAPCASIGAKVKNVSLEKLQLGIFEIHSTQILPFSSAFFDANLGVIPLDEKVILHLRAKDLAKLTLPEELEEAVTRSVMIGADQSAISIYVDQAAKNQLYLVPRNVAIDQPARLSGFMLLSVMYVIGLVVFLAIILFAYSSVAGHMLKQAHSVFAIRITHGADSKDVTARVSGFVFVALLALPIPIVGLLQFLPPPISTSARAVGATLLVISTYYVISFSRKIQNAEEET